MCVRVRACVNAKPIVKYNTGGYCVCVCAMITPRAVPATPAPVRLTVRVTCARCYAGVRSLGYAALRLYRFEPPRQSAPAFPFAGLKHKGVAAPRGALLCESKILYFSFKITQNTRRKTQPKIDALTLNKASTRADADTPTTPPGGSHADRLTRARARPSRRARPCPRPWAATPTAARP